MFGDVIVYLKFPRKEVHLDSILWVVSLNAYLVIFFHSVYKLTGDVFMEWIKACYVFAIFEMFIVWDRPWFKFIGVPMTSNTLIIFGFFFRYADRKWKLLNSFNSTY